MHLAPPLDAGAGTPEHALDPGWLDRPRGQPEPVMVDFGDGACLRRLSAWSAVGGRMRAVHAVAVLGNELPSPVAVTYVMGPLGRRGPSEGSGDLWQAQEV